MSAGSYTEQITVCSNLAGDAFTLCMDAASTVGDLKQAVADKLHVPQASQVLILGAAVAQDADLVTASQEYQLVLSVEAICEDLESGQTKRQLNILEDLLRSGPNCHHTEITGNRRAIFAVSALLEHSGWYIREVAAKVLSLVMREGDEYLLEALSPRLVHPDNSVRKAAVAALGGLVERGEASLIAAECKRLEAPAASVR
eukprot:TRINITY_DN65203_c0_g1_i1.p1 TRINITY_DN65203_c0_g1~~TRINITY_DN65203_c0_g1_i1.p1  ORF type:complete len:212 (-),score=55.25 TRINITY_DN65203_c0_g1_i1:75-677(-)